MECLTWQRVYLPAKAAQAGAKSSLRRLSLCNSISLPTKLPIAESEFHLCSIQEITRKAWRGFEERHIHCNLMIKLNLYVFVSPGIDFRCLEASPWHLSEDAAEQTANSVACRLSYWHLIVSLELLFLSLILCGCVRSNFASTKKINNRRGSQAHTPTNNGIGIRSKQIFALLIYISKHFHP